MSDGRLQSDHERAAWLLWSTQHPGQLKECSACHRLGTRAFFRNGSVTGYQCSYEVPCAARAAEFKRQSDVFVAESLSVLREEGQQQ